MFDHNCDRNHRRTLMNRLIFMLAMMLTTALAMAADSVFTPPDVAAGANLSSTGGTSGTGLKGVYQPLAGQTLTCTVNPGGSSYKYATATVSVAGDGTPTARLYISINTYYVYDSGTQTTFSISGNASDGSETISATLTADTNGLNLVASIDGFVSASAYCTRIWN